MIKSARSPTASEAIGPTPNLEGHSMKTAAIYSKPVGGTIRGELIERHGDGTVTIRFAGSLLSRGTEITIAGMIRDAQRIRDRRAP